MAVPLGWLITPPEFTHASSNSSRGPVLRALDLPQQLFALSCHRYDAKHKAQSRF